MSTGSISVQDAKILQQAFDRAGRDQEDPNADIAAYCKKLRGLPTETLRDVYSRSHRMSDLRGEPRHALLTDILRDRFGDHRVEKYLASAGKDAYQDPRIAVLKDWPKLLHDKLGQLIDNGSISPATNEADLFHYAKQAVPQAPDDDVRDCVRDLLANWQPVFDSAARDASFDRKIWKPVEIYHGWHLLRGMFENRGKFAVMEPSGQMEVYTNKQDAELHFSESKDSLTAEDAEILEEAILRSGKDAQVKTVKGHKLEPYGNGWLCKKCDKYFMSLSSPMTPCTGKKSAQDVTPPGREKQVKALKKVPGINNPWAVSWHSYEESH